MGKQNPDPVNAQDHKQTTAITLQEKTLADSVLNKVMDLEKGGGLNLPANYSAANALKSAWLILQNTLDKDKKPVLQTCTKESIANALLDMVIQGLSPVKKQCYFIAYGTQLTLSRSYHGTVACLKRLNGIENVYANCIYENDEFEYEIDLNTGLIKILKHKQAFENIDPTSIKGAYAVIVRTNLPPYVGIMNMKQIRAAWNQGAAKGNSGAHQNFSDRMCRKTVMNRTCNDFLNTSDDSDLLIGAINNTKDFDELPNTPYVEEAVEQEIKENANKEVIDIPAKQADIKPSVQGAPVQKEPAPQQKAEPTLEGPGF
ncbi:MAG: recombinase RecT [Acidobacteriota bacterium]